MKLYLLMWCVLFKFCECKYLITQYKVYEHGIDGKTYEKGIYLDSDMVNSNTFIKETIYVHKVPFTWNVSFTPFKIEEKNVSLEVDINGGVYLEGESVIGFVYIYSIIFTIKVLPKQECLFCNKNNLVLFNGNGAVVLKYNFSTDESYYSTTGLFAEQINKCVMIRRNVYDEKFVWGSVDGRNIACMLEEQQACHVDICINERGINETCSITTVCRDKEYYLRDGRVLYKPPNTILKGIGFEKLDNGVMFFNLSAEAKRRKVVDNNGSECLLEPANRYVSFVRYGNLTTVFGVTRYTEYKYNIAGLKYNIWRVELDKSYGSHNICADYESHVCKVKVCFLVVLDVEVRGINMVDGVYFFGFAFSSTLSFIMIVLDILNIYKLSRYRFRLVLYFWFAMFLKFYELYYGTGFIIEDLWVLSSYRDVLITIYYTYAVCYVCVVIVYSNVCKRFKRKWIIYINRYVDDDCFIFATFCMCVMYFGLYRKYRETIDY